MDVSVIVSTFSEDRLRYVQDCLESLRKQSMPPKEVILVLDPKPDLLTFYQSKFRSGIKIVASQKFGLSNARNAGIKNAKGDIVAFIDDDAEADTHWIENLVKAYDNEKVVGVGGRINPVWEDRVPAWFPQELNWIVGCSYKGLPEQSTDVRNPIGCNMSFRRSIFEAVGYFRSDLGRFGKMLLDSEEPELSLRILNDFPEYTIIYEPSAVVYHKVSKHRQKITYFFRRSFYQGLSKALMISAEKNSNKKLSTENQYLKYLIHTAIPSRIKHLYRLKNLAQLAALTISTTAVFLGFSLGRLVENKTTVFKGNNA